MVAPNNIQSVEFSPHFSVKDAVEKRIKENVTAPLLEMKSEPATERRRSVGIRKHSTSSSSAKNNNKKSVTFLDDVHVHEIPTLTQEEKDDVFLNKQDIQNSVLHMKRLVTRCRTGQMPEEENTKIGLEAYLNPHMNMAIRRRMTKVVLQHQHWSRQNPSSAFDDQYLAQNCTTVAKTATFLALSRAKTVFKELANDS